MFDNKLTIEFKTCVEININIQAEHDRQFEESSSSLGGFFIITVVIFYDNEHKL